jgi:excisionase family DNA binding protein
MNPSATTSALAHAPALEGAAAIPQDTGLWTTKEAAKYLHVSLKTVFNLRKRGLPYVQLGGAVRFIPQEVKDYLVSHRVLAAHRLRQVVRKGHAP